MATKVPQPGMGTKEIPGTGPIKALVTNYEDVDSRVDENTEGKTGKTGGTKKSRRSDVSLEDVKTWADKDVALWKAREERFKAHQWLAELKTEVVASGEEAITLNDPLVLIQKISGMLSKQAHCIEFRPRRPDTGKEAQAAENALRLVEREREYSWSSALHGPVKYEELQCALLRGWLCARVSFDSKAVVEWEENGGDPYEYFPWRIYLADPANIYPNNPTLEYTRVTHRFKATVGELRDSSEFDGLDESLGEAQDDEVLTITAVYEFSNRHDYHCVYTEGKGGAKGWIKKPTPMGYMPWVIVLAGGMFYRAVPWESGEEWTKHVGVGVLHTVAQNVELLNRYVTMLATVVGDSAESYKALFTDDVEIEVPERFVRGGTGKFPKDSKIESVSEAKDGTTQGIGALIEVLQSRQDRGSISPVLYGGAGAGPSIGASGFQAALFMAAAQDIIFPYVRAWELFRGLVYRKVLWLFGEQGPLDVPFMVLLPKDAREGKNTWVEFFPGDVAKQGCHVDVTLDPMTIQDKLALGNLAVMLVRENVISRKTARGKEFLRLEDPQLEDFQIIAELTRMDPRVMGMLIPAVAEALGEPELAELFRQGQAAQQAVGPGGPGGTPPGNPAGELAGPGIGSETGVPPAAQGIDQMAQMGRRGQVGNVPAAGGAGAGGIPPGT